MVPASQPSASAPRGGRSRAHKSVGASHTHAKSHQSVRGNARAPSTPEATRRETRSRLSARKASRSETIGETIGQRSRQTGGEDLSRGRAVVIVDAPDGDGALVPVPDGVRGALVT